MGGCSCSSSRSVGVEWIVKMAVNGIRECMRLRKVTVEIN